MRCLPLAGLPLFMSCLVTEPIQIPEEVNLPPSIMSAPEARAMGTALDQIVVFDEGDGAMEQEFQVVVRDPNADQSLEYQIWVDFNGSLDSLVGSGTIEPTGTMDRSFAFTVRSDKLGPAAACRKVELLVSTEFDFNIDTMLRQPVEALDIAQAVWWVRVIDTGEVDRQAIDLDSCR